MAEAVILAGGEGRRFRPYTDMIPKPMVPVGPEEKPLLEYIVAWLARHGFKRIVLLVGYKWKQIRNYFRDGSWWGVEIQYSMDEGEFTNTGGALVNAYRKGLLRGDHVLVWYGDILAPLDAGGLLRSHVEAGADATLALADNYQIPVGVAQVDETGGVIGFAEKPVLKIHVAIGVLVLRKNIIGEAWKNLGASFDIMGDMVPWMIRSGKKVKAYTYRGPWFDIGSLERYNKLDHTRLEEFFAAAHE